VKAKARVAHPLSWIGVALTLLGLTLVIPVVAQAAQTHVLTESKGPDWGYSHPVSTAVDNGTGPHAGWTYNVDSGSNFVVGNEPDGTPALGFEPPGGYVKPVAVAVDPNTGDVWVADEGPLVFLSHHGVIYKFDELGNYLASIGFEGDCPCQGLEPTAIYVDPSNGDLYATGNSTVEVFDSSGAFSRSIRPQRGPAQNQQTGSIRSIAVSPAGHLFLSDTLNGQNSETERALDEFDGSGKFIRRYGDNSKARGVAYDAANNQAIVNGGTYIAIYDAASGDEVDRFGSDKLVEGTGVAVNEATGVVQALDGSGWWYTFSPANLPDVTLAGVTNLTKSSVRLNGNVDPAGAGDASCQFEYGETKDYEGVGSPLGCTPAGPYSSSTAVSVELSGLAPATLYHYRLNGINSAGTGHSADATFITAPDAPVIASQVVGDPGSVTARVDAQIQLMGADTTVRVEYGTDTGYGSTVPAAGKVIAANGPTDRAQKLVSQQLLGLAPSTTYHFRFVATNSVGTTLGPDQILRTFPAVRNGLPDGRGYELVTPVNKDGHYPRGGLEAFNGDVYGIATDNGEAVFYPTALAIGNTASGLQNFSVARRVNGAWTPDSPYLRPQEVDANRAPSAYWPSSDLSMLAFSGLGFATDADTGGLFISNRTGTIRASGSPFATPMTGPTIGEIPGGNFTPAGAAPDLNPTYFAYDGALLPEDASREATLATRDAGGFYEFKDGQLRPAGYLPDGTLDPEGAVPAATPLVTVSQVRQSRSPSDFFNQVSADGRRAFFLSPDPGAGSPRPVQLYVHREGQASLLASVSELSGEPAATGVVGMPSVRIPLLARENPYAVASRDGSQVAFESKDQLTADAPADATVKVYLFNVGSGDLSYLSGVGGAVMAVSDDGARVFFIEGEEMSVWQEGEGLTSIATGVPTMTVVAATPNGSVLVFGPTTAAAGFNNGGLPQVYRYDTDAARLDCISCPPEGVTPQAGGTLSASASEELASFGSPFGELREPHYFAADGKRVFFETAQPLVADDINSVGDVYEWEGGEIHLISTGRSSKRSFLVDSSASGDDVFFGTADGLDPRDRDGGFDIYDARVGAGPAIATTPGACMSSCQGEAEQPPPPLQIASGAASEVRKRSGKSRGRLSVSVRALPGRGTILAVRVPAGGRLTVSGPDVNAMGRKVGAAGTYKLALALNGRAREKLEKEHRLTVKVRVTYRPVDGAPSTTNVSIALKGGERG
jgi:hypothetical protein